MAVYAKTCTKIYYNIKTCSKVEKWHDNDKSNIDFNDAKDLNCNTLQPEVDQMQPKLDIKTYARVLRQSVETIVKNIAFTKDNLQNKLDDSTLDFTKCPSNA